MKSSQLALLSCILCATASGSPVPTGAPDCGSCGGNINVYSGQPSTVASPGYPNYNYPDGCTCTWTITAPDGPAVLIRFVEPFRTEACCDNVRVFDGTVHDSILATCQGANPCPAVWALSGTMTVVFSSDGSDNYQGFGAVVFDSPGGATTTTPPVSVAPCNCGTDLTVSDSITGDLQTPGWPTVHYPNGCQCEWHITAGDDEVVYLRFKSFQTEQDDDTVQIFDGPDTGYPGIETCSGDSCDEAYSSGQYMTIYFASDGSNTFTGFGATAVGVLRTTTTMMTTTTTPPQCNLQYNVYDDQSASFQSPYFPDNYQNDASCQWTFFSQDTDYAMQLSFDSFNTEACCDPVKIYNGQDTNSPLLQTCAGDSCATLRTESSAITVTFTSDGSDTFQGFQGTVSLVNPCDCTQTFNLDSSGTPLQIKSPLFPEAYPASCTCLWTLVAPDGYKASVSFQNFTLQSGVEFVNVYDGSTSDDLLAKCTNSSCSSVTSYTSSTLVVSFTSYRSVPNNLGLGFAANAYASSYICRGVATSAINNEDCQNAFQLCGAAGEGVRLANCPNGQGYSGGVCTDGC